MEDDALLQQERLAFAELASSDLPFWKEASEAASGAASLAASVAP